MALLLTVIGCFGLGFAAGVAAAWLFGIAYCDDLDICE